LPNTVNSQQSIYIPSTEPADDTDFQHKAIPGVDYFDPLIRTGGVDLLVDSNGDLVLTEDGDTKLAVGLNNIIQKVRLALNTPKGSLLHHPDYGLPAIFGASTAEVSAQDIADAVRNLFKDDPTFTAVEAVSVIKQGPVAAVTASLAIAGSNAVIPVTVTIDT
jgi:hypothetical protein